MADTSIEMARLFGRVMSKAEFDVLLELLKATLFAASAGLVAAYFNAVTKTREQDAALFNEVIKDRIAYVHEINGAVIQLANEYLALTDYSRIAETLAKPELSLDGYRLWQTQVQAAFKTGISDFRAQLPARLQSIVTLSENRRYVVGEAQHRILCERLAWFQAELTEVWDHFYDVGLRDAFRIASVEGDSSRWTQAAYDQMTAIYRAYARVSRQRVERSLSELHDDFEAVVRTKGGATRRLYARIRRAVFPPPSSLESVQDWSVRLRASDIERKLQAARAAAARRRRKSA